MWYMRPKVCGVVNPLYGESRLDNFLPKALLRREPAMHVIQVDSLLPPLRAIRSFRRSGKGLSAKGRTISKDR